MITVMSPKNIIELKEFLENAESYIERITQGEVITVVRRSTPLFRLTPIDSEETDWQTAVDFTTLDEKGVPARAILRVLHG
jgi:antitoxin (DNA-binding transcriptional repressor) of toxin-antitoxin stability system